MEVEIKPEDISVNQVPGGTAWFPTFNGVQVTHIPTQCSVTCTEERSAHRNRAVAMEMLREKLKTWVAPVIPLAAEEIIDIIASECRNSCYDTSTCTMLDGLKKTIFIVSFTSSILMLFGK